MLKTTPAHLQWRTPRMSSLWARKPGDTPFSHYHSVSSRCDHGDIGISTDPLIYLQKKFGTGREWEGAGADRMLSWSKSSRITSLTPAMPIGYPSMSLGSSNFDVS